MLYTGHCIVFTTVCCTETPSEYKPRSLSHRPRSLPNWQSSPKQAEITQVQAEITGYGTGTLDLVLSGVWLSER